MNTPEDPRDDTAEEQENDGMDHGDSSNDSGPYRR